MVDFAPAGDLCGGAVPADLGRRCAGRPARAATAARRCSAGTIAFGIVKGGSYRARRQLPASITTCRPTICRRGGRWRSSAEAKRRKFKKPLNRTKGFCRYGSKAHFRRISLTCLVIAQSSGGLSLLSKRPLSRSFTGRFYTLKNAHLEPKPIQKPHIPIWVPGDSDAIRDLAAELADVWLFYSKPPEVIAAYAADMARRRGGRPMPMAASTVCLAGLGESDVSRWSVLYAGERKHRFAVPPTAQDVLTENLWGTNAQCVERIRAWEAAGIGHLIIQPIPPLEGMRFFAREIMPSFR